MQGATAVVPRGYGHAATQAQRYGYHNRPANGDSNRYCNNHFRRGAHPSATHTAALGGCNSDADPIIDTGAASDHADSQR